MSVERPNYTVKPRSVRGKSGARKLRQNGMIPAVVYGQGAESTAVTADPEELTKLLTTERGTNMVFELEIEGGATYANVMVRDYQIDPIRRELRHADFVVIDPDVQVLVAVPVVTEGRPRGVREGGRLQMVRGEIPVLAYPDAIPAKFVRDVEHLTMGQALLASEIELPERVEAAWKEDFAVCRVAIPRGMTAAEKEEAEAAEEAAAEAAAEGEESAEGAEGESEEANE